MTVIDILPLLRCPQCGAAPLSIAPAGEDGVLDCPGCRRSVPIVDGIPRFVRDATDQLSKLTQASFGYEWTHFHDWEKSGATNFADYFQGLELAALGHATVLDAGCGMGRHARQLAPHVGALIALDFSRAIDQARATTAGLQNVQCIQADLRSIPVATNAVDFAYSLGVLHHLDETQRALAEIVRTLKPGGRLRIYLYWKKHGWSGRLLNLVSAVRHVTTRLPFGVLRAFCAVLSTALFLFVIIPYRLLSAVGIERHHDWPLFIYTKYPFYVLYNDQFDRFSAPLEKRYDPDEVRALLEAAGLEDVRVRSCFGWLGEGIKSA